MGNLSLVRLVFEYSGTLLVNDYRADITPGSPFAMDWFLNQDLVIDNLDKRFIFNTGGGNTGLVVLQVTDKLFIIKPPSRPKPLRVTYAATHFIFPKRYVVELASNDETSFFTIYSKTSDKIAVNLGMLLQNPKTTFEGTGGSSRIILQDEGIFFSFDPQNGKVLEHKVHPRPGDSLPLTLLQHIKNKNFEQARGMLSFPITEVQLAKYFGEFEVLRNNYLGDVNTVSIIQGGKVKNLSFTVEGRLIGNIQG